MSLATIIAPHLPYLRRYGRALTGSQESGDRYVQAALETLVADPDSFPRDVTPRVGVFQVFLKVWNSIDINTLGEIVPDDSSAMSAESKISRITPLPRQAFLLVHVEDFTEDDAATALGIGLEELRAALDTADREIAEQVATDVLIIEDEPLIAMDIEDIVTSLGHRCMGVARTKDEATSVVGDKFPGLVLADIQLADGSSGIDAVNDLLKKFEAPVIFITAYPERLLTGDRPEPTFLLTKPFQPATLKAVISQALFFDQKASLKHS